MGDILMHPQTTFSADILIQVVFCICIMTRKLQPVTFGDCGSKSKGHHYSHFSRVHISPAVSVKWSLNIIWSREGCGGKQSGPQASCGTDQWTSPLLHTLHLCCLSPLISSHQPSSPAARTSPAAQLQTEVGQTIFLRRPHCHRHTITPLPVLTIQSIDTH